jgi:hypothetical protein
MYVAHGMTPESSGTGRTIPKIEASFLFAFNATRRPFKRELSRDGSRILSHLHFLVPLRLHRPRSSSL